MKKNTFIDLATIIMWMIPVVYLLFSYSSLPDIVPMHYDMQGKVDRYGNRSELIWVEVIMFATSLGVYALLRFLPLIDPKKAVQYGNQSFKKIALGVVMLISVLNVIILYTTLHPGVAIDKLIFTVIALFYCFMGNMMYNIRPNYFAGIRTPWTLENEENWKVTHRLAGKTWFVGGIIIAAITLLLPGSVAAIVFLIATGIIALIPIIYSFLWFKKHQLHEK